ncbi:hypothetical protein D3C78_1570430 [compost metagenome]
MLIPFTDAPAIQYPTDGAIFMLHAMQRFIKRRFTVQMVIKRIQHHFLVFRMKMFAPDLKLRIQLFRLVAEHRSPATIIDNQLSTRDVELPQA